MATKKEASQQGILTAICVAGVHKDGRRGWGFGTVFTDNLKLEEGFFAVGEKVGVAVLAYFDLEDYRKRIWELIPSYVYLGLAYAGSMTLKPLGTKDFEPYIFVSTEWVDRLKVKFLSVKPQIAASFYEEGRSGLDATMTLYYEPYWPLRELLGVDIGTQVVNVPEPVDETQSLEEIGLGNETRIAWIIGPRVSVFKSLLQFGYVYNTEVEDWSIFVRLRPVLF